MLFVKFQFLSLFLKRNFKNYQSIFYLTKLLLKFLVGKVDTELFEAILLECLEAIDV